MTRFALAAMAIFYAWAAAAQPVRPLPPDTDAMRAMPLQAGEQIVLDGSLSHPAWQRAPVFQRFIEKDPVNGGPPPQTTQVQVLFDERALYVGVTSLDTRPELIRNVLVRADGVNRTQDFVVVYIDAIGARQSAQFFRINAAGSTADGMHTAADDSEDFSPDFDWDGAAMPNAQGWTAVLRLPFASLRFAAGQPDQWRIMVARRLPREQFHLFASVPIPRDAPSFIHNLQPLRGVALPADTQFLNVRPSITLRTLREAAPAGTSGSSTRQNDADLSLDIKWRPLPELVVDGTLNPDFSQVALDVPQLAGNSRFALFFPEKRPFFFESADLLRSPTEAFYTRSFTAPRWGVRGTWRGSTLAGSLFALDDRGQGLVLLPGPYGTGFTEQPASRSLAGRVRADQGALQWGGLLAARQYEKGAGENTVLGPDAGWQIDDAWRVRGQWLHSRTSAFTDGRTVDGDRVYLRAFRNRDADEFNMTIDDVGSGFRHDTGFVNQVGVRKLAAFASHGWFGVGPFNSFFVNTEVQRVTDRSNGQVVQQSVRPGVYFTAPRNLESWFEVYLPSQLRTAPGAPLLGERYVSTGLVVTPARWFPLLNTDLAIGRLADTAANQVRPGGRWNMASKLRLLAQLELEPSVSVAWLKSAGALVYRESAAQWLAVWHFDARQNLRGIVQSRSLDRRAEAGVDAERSASQVASLTYTWRQSAGSVLYVGASRAKTGLDAPVRTTEAFVKLQVDVAEVRSLISR